MATAISTGTLPRRIFISYARKDGAETAQSLRTTLEAANHVWLDTDRIHGGVSWSKAIESALNNFDFLRPHHPGRIPLRNLPRRANLGSRRRQTRHPRHHNQ